MSPYVRSAPTIEWSGLDPPTAPEVRADERYTDSYSFRDWSRLAYSSMAPPICRKCCRKVYDGSAARRARYSPKVVCWRRV
jgi:hypothetical protein